MQYDRWAPGYDRRWRGYTERTHEELLVCAQLGRASAVLDVGCGTGELIWRLLARWPHLHIVGVEPSAGMRQVARRKLAPLVEAGRHIALIAGDAEALPVADASIDAVMLANVMHYLSEPLAALEGARRVLRPGGQLLLVDYLPRCLSLTLADAAIRLYDRAHQHIRTGAELANLLDRGGFSVRHTREFRISPGVGGVVLSADVPAPGRD